MTIKRLAAYIGLAFIAILFLSVLFDYLTTGKLVIDTTDGFNTITVSSIDNNGQGSKVLSKKTGKSLSVKLKGGNYIASVEGRSLATSQLINVKVRKTLHYAINNKGTVGVEPVVAKNARSFAADSSSLVYLDPTNSTLNQINAQNNLQQLVPKYSFQSVKWAGASYGIGQTTDGQLLILDNGGVKPIDISYIASGNTSVEYAVTQNKEFYLVIGSSVYKGSGTHGFSKIYDKRVLGSTIVAGLNNIALVDTGDSDNKSSGKPSITTIDQSGSVTKRPIGTLFAAWSQNDKYLAIGSTKGGEILDRSLKHVATIPQNTFNNPVWVNDQELFYAVNDQLWSYDLSTQRAQLVANMPLGSTVSEMVLNTDNSYLYMTTSSTDGVTAIRRVGLRGQAVSDAVYSLQSILPEDLDDYSLGLVNFAGLPTVQVTPNPGSDPPADLQAAKTELQNRGFDITKLNLTLQARASD